MQSIGWPLWTVTGQGGMGLGVSAKCRVMLGLERPDFRVAYLGGAIPKSHVLLGRPPPKPLILHLHLENVLLF